MSSLTTISDAEFVGRVLDAPGTVLVDFYADWCGPCRALAPVLEKVAAEQPHATVVKVDVDASQMAGQFGVMSVPTVVAFRGGREVDRAVGMVGKARIEQMIG